MKRCGPIGAVAIVWSSDFAMHGRVEECSTSEVATRWRLRFAAVSRAQLRSAVSFAPNQGCFRDSRRYRSRQSFRAGKLDEAETAFNQVISASKGLPTCPTKPALIFRTTSSGWRSRSAKRYLIPVPSNQRRYLISLITDYRLPITARLPALGLLKQSAHLFIGYLIKFLVPFSYSEEHARRHVGDNFIYFAAQIVNG